MLLGQQCDNNFRTENVPCNHLGDSNNGSRKRRDLIAHNSDEVLTRQQQQQSSGHLSFATRYNSREKRNNNSGNEFDNNDDNNNDNDMPIHKKYMRKIEKKKEDGYAKIVEQNSKHKVECSNDIYSWARRRTTGKEERDNQQSTNKSRYTNQIPHISRFHEIMIQNNEHKMIRMSFF